MANSGSFVDQGVYQTIMEVESIDDLADIQNEIRFDARLKDKALTSNQIMGVHLEDNRYFQVTRVLSIITNIFVFLYIFLLPFLSTPKWCIEEATKDY